MKYSIVFLSFLLSASLFGMHHNVGRGQEINSVTKAISQAKSGDTLFIHSGFYQEKTIEINKALTIIGLDFPILDGNLLYEILTISHDSVSIIGLQIQNSGVASLTDPGGIRIKRCNNVLISNCRLIDNFFGIYLEGCSHCTLQNNYIRSHGYLEDQIGNGIHAWKCDSLIINHNFSSGHRDGIYFEFVKNSVIWRNVVQKNVRYGLHFMFSNNDSYFTNYFFSNGSGVAVMFSNHVTMMNNTFEENWGDASYGLLLKEISDSYLAGNRFIHNTIGVFMEGTSRINSERNAYYKNGWAMKIQASCMENKIFSSNFIGNTFDISSNGMVYLNEFNSNYWDKYKGYDLDKNQFGDVPFRPLSLYNIIIESNPTLLLLYQSLMVQLIDQSERIFPSLTPENFKDNNPKMKPYPL